MTKPFVLDEDGDISIVGPPGLEQLLDDQDVQADEYEVDTDDPDDD